MANGWIEVSSSPGIIDIVRNGVLAASYDVNSLIDDARVARERGLYDDEPEFVFNGLKTQPIESLNSMIGFIALHRFHCGCSDGSLPIEEDVIQFREYTPSQNA